MSLSIALNAALSGLTASGRAASVVSNNVANAMTEGYGRREIELTARALGQTAGGVQVTAERRVVSAGLLADRRGADAAMGGASARAGALARVEQMFGLPGDPGALATRLSALEGAIAEAVSRPDAPARLETVMQRAQDLVAGFGVVGGAVQEGRARADAGIADAVSRLNDGLARVHDLNRAVLREVMAGRTPNALFDQRQQAIDSISDLVPLREVTRPNGQVVLYTDSGAVLLDGRPSRVGFAASGSIDAGTSLGSGALSGLTLNGVAVSTGAQGPLSGGVIGGLFDLRDRLLPEVQQGLDALAGELVARFAAADAASLAPAGLGLFTDAGGPVDAAPGLAQRLALNPAADPAAGGALWRLRDGLGAITPGLPGDSRTLTLLAGALSSVAAPSDPALQGVARDMSGLLAEVQGRLGATRGWADGSTAFAAARSAALREAQASDGVDTDAEMQKLLLIERAYAANARVLRAADEMLQTLLSI